ncbi:MAG: hypothetical protein ACYS9X_16210 [Planctomycetota bacterium]|jgi:gas vesicle protein
MGKILAGVALGVFVGAMVAEILRKTNPKWLQNVGAKLKNSAKAAKEAFMEGYAGAEKAPEAETA